MDGLPRDLSRRERRKLEMRTRILEAARALFAERGFHATRVAEICDRADVAHKTFFNYFPTKQHLVRALAIAALEQLMADIEAVRKEPGTTRERLEQFFGQIADNAASAGPMHRELLTETIHALNDAREQSAAVRRLHEGFGAIVADGVAAGELTRAHGVDTLSEVVLGTFYTLMFNWAHIEGYPLRSRALAAARFLADALARRPEEDER